MQQKITRRDFLNGVAITAGSAITRGIGMTIEPEPGSGPIEPGRAANLVLKGANERKMHDGEWVP